MGTRRVERLPHTTPHLMYMAESEGVCYVLTFSELDIFDKGGKAELEATLADEYVWIEFLGIILQYEGPDHAYMRGDDIERLVLRSSRRMARLDSPMEIQYFPIDSVKSRNN